MVHVLTFDVVSRHLVTMPIMVSRKRAKGKERKEKKISEQRKPLTEAIRLARSRYDESSNSSLNECFHGCKIEAIQQCEAVICHYENQLIQDQRQHHREYHRGDPYSVIETWNISDWSIVAINSINENMNMFRAFWSSSTGRESMRVFLVANGTERLIQNVQATPSVQNTQDLDLMDI